MFNLLKDRAVRTGQLDARATASLRRAEETAAVRRSGNELRSRSAARWRAAALPQSSVAGSPVDLYFKHDLAFATQRDVQRAQPRRERRVESRGHDRRESGDRRCDARDPKLRLFWTGGYFDITTPLLAARYALDQAGIPGERVTGAAFPAGHSVFMEAANRAALSAAVRKFVTR